MATAMDAAGRGLEQLGTAARDRPRWALLALGLALGAIAFGLFGWLMVREARATAARDRPTRVEMHEAIAEGVRTALDVHAKQPHPAAVSRSEFELVLQRLDKVIERQDRILERLPR